MPVAPIDVDTDVYLSAGERFLAVNGEVCDAVTSAASSAGLGGGMAGTDSSGVEWSAGYDDAAGLALAAGATLADALGHVGSLLDLSGGNHADAETASTSGSTAASCPPGNGAPDASSVIPAPLPSADGTDDNPPPGWFLIAHLLQYTWPNGHQDVLRDVAAGWTRAAEQLTDCADRLIGPIADVGALASPEVAAAVATCSDVQSSTRELSAAYARIGASCSEYADRLDEAHSQVIDELVEFAGETAAIQVASAIAAGMTAGGSELVGQGAETARTAVTAGRVARILGELTAVVRAVTATIRVAVTRITEVLARMRVVLAKGGTRAIELIAPQLRSDWPVLSNMLRAAARGKGNFGMGIATAEQIDAMGMAWVGPGAKLSSSGKAWISADGLRQYRPPQWKPREGRTQANFERRELPLGRWTHDGHVDVEG